MEIVPGMSPMMVHYLQTKQENPDCILFYRLGDFYEMFFEDAVTVSRELELVLTGRDCGLPERAPMCGVPFHSYENYMARLVAKGYKVAICEQLEDPSQAKGLVSRGIIRVVTPGTVIEGCMLDEGRNNYLCVLCVNDDWLEAGICFADCSTGEVHAACIRGGDVEVRLMSELGRFAPSEVLINCEASHLAGVMAFLPERLQVTPQVCPDTAFDKTECRIAVEGRFGEDSVPDTCVMRAIGCALGYLRKTQMGGLERMNRLHLYSDAQYMHLDASTRRNLELTETMRGKEKRGSLLGVLDRTRTAMGKRLIRTWIEQPLVNPTHILRRHNAVEELLGDMILRSDLRELLADIHDVERIMTRVVHGSVNARELRSLSQAILHIAPMKLRMQNVYSATLEQAAADIDELEDVSGLIERAIADEPPLTVREGGMIREGYNAELDELHLDMSDSKSVLARIEAAEKERTGIKTLKVGYNRVFGYYIEVTRQYSDQVPETYIRKQTLAGAERYITQELKEIEARVLGAHDRAVALEYELFQEIRTFVAEQLPRIQRTAAAVAEVDVLCSFAEVAARRRYCRPTVDMSGVIDIKNGRHPVVESLIDVPFVPNDTLLDNRDNRCAIITGPNMAGKSTYMRQTALIVLMSQIGSFVPAESATLSVVDSIFTRVGASDDLAAGQSTFMVEMSEVAHILKNATANSLIVFDEIGRGTSTFDGMSIARAVLEYTADTAKLGAKTLFATHYHELTVMEQELPGIRNYNIAVKKRGDDITFLRRIVRGPADDSYGIEVAKLAGIPDSVVARAKSVLQDLLSGQTVEPAKTRQTPVADSGQMSLLGGELHPLVQQLRELDVNTLTPIEALQTLYRLCEESKQY